MYRIRPVEKSDRAAVVEILNQAIRSGTQIAFLSEVSLEERQHWFEDHQSPLHPMLVAEHDERVVGWISLSAYRPGREALRHTVEVSYGVEASMRRKGVGTAMLRRILEEARKLGHRIVFAIVFDNNVATLTLLKKCEFEQWGHLPEVAELNGKLVGHDYLGMKLKGFSNEDAQNS